jgi:ribosomal protein L32
VGHRRELATDGMPSQKESTVHDRNFAIETTRRTMNFQRTANSVLTVCLTSGAGSHRNSICQTSQTSMTCAEPLIFLCAIVFLIGDLRAWSFAEAGDGFVLVNYKRVLPLP